MKTDIHPTYNETAAVVCTSCNNEFAIGSTADKITVELCHKCHPFYTGTQRLVDTGQRVERFKQRMAKRSDAAEARKGKKVKKAKQEEAKKTKEEKDSAK